MTPVVTNLILISMSAFALLAIVDAARQRRFRSGLFQLGAVVAAYVVLHVTTGFPSARVPFGGATPTLAIGLMFVSIILGIAANSVFYARAPFSWLAFLKPLVISPIVLLPLVGSIQGMSGIEAVQLISLCCLAFQNGFFWKTVLTHARTDRS